MSTARPLVAGLVAAAATRAVAVAAEAAPPGGRQRWTRINHAGRPVSLLEGPAYVIGAALGSGMAPRGHRAAGLVAALGAGGAGLLDDLTGATDIKGLRGHLSALRRGQVTTGAIKIGALAATGLAAALLDDRAASGTAHANRDVDTRARSRRSGGAADLLSTAVGAVVIAAAANVVNLFDLRPGRALKVTALAGLPLAGTVPAAAALGAAGAALPDDLAGRTMLGDTGANAAGALLGLAVVQRYGWPGRLVAAVALAALVLASERVSFSRVIADTPVLRELDALGRRSPR